MSKKTWNIIYTNNLPLYITILFLFCLYIPTTIFLPQNIRPLLGLASVFYWLIHKEEDFGVISVLIISIIADTLSAAPFGSNILMYFSLFALINRFEKFLYNKSFLLYWYGFMILSFFAIFIKWFALSLFYGQLLPIYSTFFTYLTTIFSYPIISIINKIIQNYMEDNNE